MNIKIHHGTQEIVGSCVEVRTSKTSIVIDFGLPLTVNDGSWVNPRSYEGFSARELVSKRVLPNIEGVYKGSAKLIDGILISHQNHYGFVSYLDPNLKYYIGEASYKIINSANIFKDTLFSNHVFYEKNKPFVIGDLKITPYWLDQSSINAHAFLIEGDRKSILYAGDFSGRGVSTEAYKGFLRYAPKNMDYLLLEGAMPGRSKNGEESDKNLHTVIPGLQEFVIAIQPKNIIPIHTFAGERFKNLFKENIVELKDGVELSV